MRAYSVAGAMRTAHEDRQLVVQTQAIPRDPSPNHGLHPAIAGKRHHSTIHWGVCARVHVPCRTSRHPSWSICIVSAPT